MTVDTALLRTRSRNLDQAGFPHSAEAVAEAADEIDALRAALAATPHAPLCHLLMVRDGEPCSCAKSALSEVAVMGTASTLYPDVHRLTVAGPHGRVLGLPAIAGVRLDVDQHHLTVNYSNP